MSLSPAKTACYGARQRSAADDAVCASIRLDEGILLEGSAAAVAEIDFPVHRTRFARYLAVPP